VILKTQNKLKGDITKKHKKLNTPSSLSPAAPGRAPAPPAALGPCTSLLFSILCGGRVVLQKSPPSLASPGRLEPPLGQHPRRPRVGGLGGLPAGGKVLSESHALSYNPHTKPPHNKRIRPSGGGKPRVLPSASPTCSSPLPAAQAARTGGERHRRPWKAVTEHMSCR
jgi:hypothetical protein